jgi:hypothetical protein
VPHFFSAACLVLEHRMGLDEFFSLHSRCSLPLLHLGAATWANIFDPFPFHRIREFLLLFGHLSHSFFYLFPKFCAALFCSGDLLLLDTLQMASAPQPLAAEADLPSPVDDYTPTFYVGHHESRRPLPVTDFVLRQAQDVGVSAPRQPRGNL